MELVRCVLTWARTGLRCGFIFEEEIYECHCPRRSLRWARRLVRRREPKCRRHYGKRRHDSPCNLNDQHVCRHHGIPGGGESTCSRLLADCKHYGVCINSPTAIAVLDAVLPQSATSTRFLVGVEDGRQFSQCLLSTVNTVNTSVGGGPDHFDNPTRPYTYCFKCEDVAVPAAGP